jgi:hypothetical protein
MIPRRDLLRSGIAFSASSAIACSPWAHAAALLAKSNSALVLIEAESFRDTGGWIIDQEFMSQMGSAFLLAHGMGMPVKDAVTEAAISTADTYRVWVRTRDWVAPWKAPGAPGRFKLQVNGEWLEPVFGTEGEKWHWQDGGKIHLPQGRISLRLHDLTGFEGRCDAILLAADSALHPPDDGPVLAAFRKQALGLGPVPEDAGRYDLIVVGGGIAGCTAAISAARMGLKVALIQDRPVLGGNSSSEIRVSPVGAVNLPPYPSLGNVVAELDPGHPGPNLPSGALYGDDRKLAVVREEKNIRLFTNTHVFSIEKNRNAITAVLARDIMTSRELHLRAPLFADCTGDGHLGFLAGADYRYGRESLSETDEPSAQETRDDQVSGTTIMWSSENTGRAVPFPETPWALIFDEESTQNATSGGVHWEGGCTRDQIAEAELIRDSLLRAIYGNWAFQKNLSKEKENYANLRLAGWVGCIAGKRESRRLLGDVVLREQDILNGAAYPDACVTATWCMDLHVPDPKNLAEFKDDSFRTVAVYIKKPPYAMPYRCLYSRNIDNLFMAGRNVSVTHVALGTVRVQRTTGMMGEVVGMAAAVARAHNASPRDVYEKHFAELKEKMMRGAGKSALASPEPGAPDGYELAWSDEFDGNSLDEAKWEARDDSEDWGSQLPRALSVSDGKLIINLNKEAADGRDEYTGAASLSKDLYGYVPDNAPGSYIGGGVLSKGEFGYGYYEFRARIMAGKGWRTSISLIAQRGAEGNAGSGASFELQVMENGSIDPLSYWVDARESNGQLQSFGRAQVSTPPLSDYHIYGCEYGPGEIKFFLNSRLVKTVDISLQVEEKVRIQLGSIASDFGDTDIVDNSRLPCHVDFDFARFYRRINGAQHI